MWKAKIIEVTRLGKPNFVLGTREYKAAIDFVRYEQKKAVHKKRLIAQSAKANPENQVIGQEEYQSENEKAEGE